LGNSFTEIFGSRGGWWPRSLMAATLERERKQGKKEKRKEEERPVIEPV
jgi:hypothetical protein